MGKHLPVLRNSRRRLLLIILLAVAALPLPACGGPVVDPAKRPYRVLEAVGTTSDGIAFSPDGKLLAVGLNSVRDDIWVSRVALWQVSDWAQLPEVRLGEGVMDGDVDVAFSPDSTLLAAGFSRGQVQVYGTADRALRQSLRTGQGDVSVAFSPDGEELAAVGRSGNISRWRVSDWAPLPAIQMGGKDAIDLAYSPDGQTIATGGNDEDVWLWRVSGGSEPKRLRGHTKAVNSLAYSPDGQTLASGGYDDIARLWQASDGQPLYSLEASTTDIVFSPDGRTVVAGGLWGALHQFNVSDGKLLATLSGPPGSDGISPKIFSLAFSPNGKVLAAGSAGNDVWLWEMP